MSLFKPLNEIDVVVLCGGLGTRLQEVLPNTPKILCEVDDKPFLDQLIEQLTGYGFKRIILCTGHLSEQVEAYIEKYKGVEVICSIEESPLGTAGAIKNAERFIQSEPFVALNGDTYFDLNMEELVNYHQTNKNFATLVVSPESLSSAVGSIQLDAEDKILSFKEKEKGVENSYISLGLYVFQKAVLAEIEANKKVSLEYDVFPNILNKRTYGFHLEGKWVDFGTPDGLSKAKERESL